jgi:hypothetical protein
MFSNWREEEKERETLPPVKKIVKQKGARERVKGQGNIKYLLQYVAYPLTTPW